MSAIVMILTLLVLSVKYPAIGNIMRPASGLTLLIIPIWELLPPTSNMNKLA